MKVEVPDVGSPRFKDGHIVDRVDRELEWSTTELAAVRARR